MNTLRIVKGKDIEICVNGDVLCFVTDFVAKEQRRFYKIDEILSEDSVDEIELACTYQLTVTALSHFDSSVFENDGFTLTVNDKSEIYEYSGCRLIEKRLDVNASGPIVNKFIIEAKSLNAQEVQDE